jgi:hypothetical protein
MGNLDAVAAHLKADGTTKNLGLEIQCDVGVRLGDVKRLQECAPALLKALPGDPKSIFYNWVLATQTRDYDHAMALLKQARGVTPADQLKKMEQATLASMPAWQKGFRDWRFGALVAFVLFGALAFLVRRGSSQAARTPSTQA